MAREAMPLWFSSGYVKSQPWWEADDDQRKIGIQLEKPQQQPIGVALGAGSAFTRVCSP